MAVRVEATEYAAVASTPACSRRCGTMRQHKGQSCIHVSMFEEEPSCRPALDRGTWMQQLMFRMHLLPQA